MYHIFKKNYKLDIKHFVPMWLVQFNRTWEVNLPEILPTTMNTQIDPQLEMAFLSADWNISVTIPVFWRYEKIPAFME